ncbi:MAG: ABC transporter ATP-binding protein/permease [Furfurilactobacillus sp.]|jgi:ABC-type multidrug transport system fused ATPase/permease subunit|uniref:ABC transporter transmembrane domain-containing protein n=1 Tax=Furfurilactobacillus TaxID=2767882 RepID=UPI001F2D7DE0|nr:MULTISPECIES: ABC transporter ATP-binding protein [Furfurilactobacillus]MCF6419515.1 ABC transporter ATP-binding protein/permease [Furfurilactobacillus milii]MCH4037539.1 ABC transporter ATP-binding protein/permease [Furfurilactobacillus sp.]MCI1339897.1 ABC transporter ATP-binding protein/permease [Furfurilactobacillus sp.]MCI1386955.1 ABC transporter ATP-binding protein/permease [Furfurilactobacillus sp.]MCI1510792.1 ABC transporter ATP-binding protein/permease [Furfurilactobacillus sp.]
MSLVLLILLPVASLVEISVSYLLQAITDSVSGRSHFTYQVLVGIVIGYMFLDAFTYFLSSYFEQLVLNRIMAKLRAELADSLLHRSIGLGKDAQTISTQYFNDFTNTLNVVHDDYLQGSVNAYKQLCQFAIAMILSITIQPVFSLIIVVLCLPALLVPILQRHVLKNNKRQVLESSEMFTHSLRNIINGLRTIQLFTIQSLIYKGFQSQNSHLLHSENSDQLRRKQVGSISQLLNNILYLGTWIVGIYFVMQREVTLGQLVAFSQLMIFIAEPIQSASGLLGDIVGGKEAAISIDTVLSQTETLNPEAKQLTQFERFSYDNVTYYDGEKPVLQNISASFVANKHYLIVGKSGSGKSSMINTLFTPNVSVGGKIRLNGCPIQDFQPFSIYQRVGLLEQESYVFDDTLRNNLSMFDDGIEDSTLIAVLNKVGLEQYASSEGLAAMVSNGGNNLSGGERRRLTLGRMLLRQYSFMFLDEPLSGLDPKTSRDIIDVLIAIKQMGWALVTHQFDAKLFDAVDEIVVIENGAVAATGSVADKNVKIALKRIKLL